jgi:tetraacyldisaccharide 4'-kinase
MVDPKRARAVERLLQSGCDVIVSDDGLQHRSMGRSIEIVLIDGKRRLGNRRCLPIGPLREPISRLKKVDYLVCNGAPLPGEIELKLITTGIYRVKDDTPAAIELFVNKKIHAVAGIGNPERFFSTLVELNLSIIPHVFRDHYPYRRQDFDFLLPTDLVIMTEKDAVKCRAFADERFCYVAVAAQLPAEFLAAIALSEQ